MINIEAKFSFFRAGQGSFYGGRIWHHDTGKVFTVVYDCGTSHFIAGNTQSLNNEISCFKYRHQYFPYSNVIDLLFISHLDYDHVSGLKRLLKEFKIINIVLPYIEKQHRQFFLVSISHDNLPDDFLINEYASFLVSPNQFIRDWNENKETNIFFIKSNSNSKTEYQGYNDDDLSENIYPRGTLNTDTEELKNQQDVLVYENNLQFFIQQKWEFTTYAKRVNEEAITKLKNCLKKKLKKKVNEDLTLDDLKKIVTEYRNVAQKCYADCIGEINSHGLVLLHGPIRFERVCGRIQSYCELHRFCNDYYHRHFHEAVHFRKNNPIMLGTLLLGDTSINPRNNPIDLPKAFKAKLVNVNIVQVPHHGSSINWDYGTFEDLKIGASISRWNNRVIAVCNFGFGNKYGHPSHEVLNDLRSTIFLNTQFSGLNIKYDIIH
jgi:hypothetical protein